MALFDYGNTRLRARLSTIQPLQQLEAFCDYATIDSFISALTKTPYRASIETALTFAHGYGCLSRAMNLELEKIAADMRLFYSGAEGELVKRIFLRDDQLNLVSILRGHIHKIPMDEVEDSFLSMGTLPLAYLREFAKAKNLDDAVNRMALYQLPVSGLLLKLRASREDLKFSEINLLLEKWFFQMVTDLLKGASENHRLLRDFYQIEADIANVNTLLRSLDSPQEFRGINLDEVLISQGSISVRRLLKLSKSTSVEGMIRMLIDTKYGRYFRKALECFADTHLLSEFENQMRMYKLDWMAKLPALFPLGIGVPLGYYARKTSEIRNLRWIGKGISSGFESRYIRENLVRVQ